MMGKITKYFLIFFILVFLLSACNKTEIIYDDSYRLASIPDDGVKITPENDLHPPILHSQEFMEPVPVEAISSAGAEDSAFIPTDRDELYFMFVKDVRETPEIQVKDRMNGIWVSKKIGGEWSAPTLVMLQKEKELALNGAEFITHNEMIFVSAREGYEGLNWFRATLKDGIWSGWKKISFTPEYEVGELHIHEGKIYFHSYMEGGKGDMDIWVADIENDTLSNLKNVDTINTDGLEGWPYISPDGKELWFTGNYKGTAAVYRSIMTDRSWGEPELIVSQFAGEPTLDSEGNLYFSHHYFKDGVMLEADIYVAKRYK